MKNLILDPYQHGPSLYYSVSLLGDTDYFTDPSRVNNTPYLYGYYSKEQINSLYKIPSQDIQIDRLKEQYDNLFIVMSPSDMAWKSPNGDEIPDKPQYCIDYYKSILNKVNANKIFIIDDSDLSQPEIGFLEKLGLSQCPILKKSISTLHYYPKNWTPFPYVYVGVYDPIYYFNSDKITDITKESDKVFWAGSQHAAFKPDTAEWYNRGYWLKNFEHTHIDNFNLRGDILGGYGTRCQKFKFAFYLRGWNDVTRRFVEIMRAKSLMLIERSTIDIGIGEYNSLFEPECYFSTLHELILNYEKLKDPTIYNRCIAKQNYIANTYFSYEAIAKKIKLII